MTNKPDARMYETFALMARGRPLHKIEALCEKQKTVACSVLARMVEEAQDINTDYALTIRYSHEASRAADKARIAELVKALRRFIDADSQPSGLSGKYGNALTQAVDKLKQEHDQRIAFAVAAIAKSGSVENES